MRNALYAPFRPELQHLEPFSVQDDDILQIYTKTSSNANEANLPPHGELKRPAISVGQRVIALRGKDILGKTKCLRTNSLRTDYQDKPGSGQNVSGQTVSGQNRFYVK